VLKGGVYHLPKGLGVDESTLWGEYFFIEALDDALRTMHNPVHNHHLTRPETPVLVQ
jgi:unsaturated chondroitin disaccharide hydrolase